MAVIIENKHIEDNIFSITLSGIELGNPGQFLMLKPNNALDPILGRPISIFDVDEKKGHTILLYQVVGKGTEIISKLKQGDNIDVYGPYGNGFTLSDSDTTLIGGGIGIAPLYYLAKAQKKTYPDKKVTLHLGFRSKAVLIEQYKEVCDDLKINLGGYVTDDVDFAKDDIYYTCGPTPMMKVAAKLSNDAGRDIYVSLENKMACGVGACLACSCHTIKGNKRVCKDGPVFLGSEVFYE